MKKFSFLALAAADMLFAACSSDKDVAENGAPVIETQGDSYIGFTIQLPSAEATTRANDDLNNGEEDEFLVAKAKLVLFKGAYDSADPIGSANAATFFKAYNFEGIYENDAQGANETPTTKVTTTSTAVAKIDKLTLTSGQKLWAYVVLNPNGSGFDSPTTGQTFADFSKVKADAASIGGNVNGVITGADGLLMTNSPISDKLGGTTDPTGAKVTTLVLIDENNIKSTKAEAKNAPAACIFVERAAAKVTILDGIAPADHKITMGGSDVNFEIDGWQVINTEPKYYNTRQCEDAWLPYFSEHATNAFTKWRFVTKDAFAPTLPSTSGHTTAYRTYFAKDIQYAADATGLVNPQANVTGTWNAIDGRAFVPENTFDVEHQTWRNTTMVTLRVKFNGGTGFYTLSDDANKYDKTNAQNKLQSNISAINEIRTWLTNACKDISHNKASDATVTATLTVTLPATPVAGVNTYEVGVSFSDGTNSYDVDDITDTTLKGDWTTKKATAEAAYTATYYDNGYAYYNVRIQHFGEFETPWQSDYAAALGTGETDYTVNHIYGWDDSDTDKQATANKNYLGRYGVVRDNWYRLNITGIAKLGSATPVDVSDKDTPDDLVEDEYYISAHVHILPWVLRTQAVSL